MSIRSKLIIIFLAIALIPILLVSAVTFHNYKSSLESHHFARLEDLVKFKVDTINAYFDNLKTNIQMYQGAFVIRQGLPALSLYASDPAGPEFTAARKLIDDMLRRSPEILGLIDIMLLDPEGRIVYSRNPGHSHAEFLSMLPDPGQSSFKEGKDKIYLSGIFSNNNNSGKPGMLITAPAFDQMNLYCGVIAFEIDLSQLYKFILDAPAMGWTGEILLGKRINDQALYLSPLKSDPDAALKRRVSIGGKTGIPIQEAVQGKTGAGLYSDYRGEKVVAAWDYIPSLGWGIVAKIDSREVFSDIIRLRNLVIIILSIIIFLSAIIAFSIAQSISQPIIKLSNGAEQIGRGNLDYAIEIDLKDEFGQLSRSFNKMAQDLKKITASRDELDQQIIRHQQAEEALRCAKEEWERTFNSVPDLIAILDNQHRIIRANKAMAERLGLTPETCVGLSCYEAVHGSSQVPEWCPHAITCQDCQEHSSEVHEPRLGGDFMVSTTPLFNGEGKIIGAVHVARDITERKRSEEALRKAHDELDLRIQERTEQLKATNAALNIEINSRIKAEEVAKSERQRLYDVLETLPVYVVLLTADYHVLFANRFFRERFGESGGKRCFEYLFKLDAPCENCDTYKVMKTRAPHRWEWLGPDNRNYDIFDFPFTDVDGSPLIMEMGIDITMQKQAQESLKKINLTLEDKVAERTALLRESELDLNRAQLVAGIGSWRLNVVKNELRWSQEVYRIFAVPEGTAMTYEIFLSKIHPDDREYVDRKWKVALSGGTYDIEHRILAGEKVKWVREKAELEFDQQGKLLGGFGTVQDITERKRMEADLIESEQRVRLKLESILSPEGDISNLELADIVDAKTVQALMDNFHELSHIPMAIIDLKGKVLVGVGWQKICTDFHRVNPTTCQYCIDSDTQLSSGVNAGDFKLYKCKNNLWDVATPLIVGGRKVGNIFMGQFFFDDEKPDYEFFKVQARKYGFNEKEYLAALDAVPRLSRKNMERGMGFFLKLSQMLSRLSYSNIKLARSLTERDKIEEALRQTRDYLENLFDYANAPIICWDPEFKITRFNHAFEYLTDYTYEEVAGKDLKMLFPDDSKEESLSKIKRTLTGEHWDVVEIPILRKDKEIRIALWNSANVYAEDGKTLVATIAQGQDITARKKITEALRESNIELERRVAQRTEELMAAYRALEDNKRLSDIGTLAATVAHELRNPLAAIKMAAYNIKRKAQNPVLDKHIVNIDTKVGESEQIINNLLFYSRIKVARSEQAKIHDIVEECVSSARERFALREVSLNRDIESLKGVVLEVDVLQVKEVFNNILNNAFDALPKSGGSIEISSQVMDNSVQVKIKDNGCGIDEEHLEKIFDPFFTTKAKGTGLGLSVSNQIVRLHGGTINIESRKDKGTTVNVILPLNRKKNAKENPDS